MTSALIEARRVLATANRILANEGIVDAFGHVSVRHPLDPARFLLSRSLSPALVMPDDVMEFRLDGSVANDDARSPYLERFIHGGIYEARQDIGAVVHSHSHSLIPFGVTGTPIRPLMHVAGPMGCCMPVWDIADEFGDTSLLVTNIEQGRSLAAKVGDGSGALMRGHGGVVAAASVRDAVLIAIYVQENATLDLQARQLGKVKYLSKGEVKRSPAALLADGPASRAWDYFESRCKNIHF